MPGVRVPHVQMLTWLAGVCYTTRLLDLGLDGHGNARYCYPKADLSLYLFLWVVAVPENAYSEHLRRM